MRAINITQSVRLINKINSKIDFTEQLVSEEAKRYIVSVFNAYTGRNPSIEPGLIIKVGEIVGTKAFDSIGGWTDSETGIYYVDFNNSFDKLTDAIADAEATNQIAIYDTIEQKEIRL